MTVKLRYEQKQMKAGEDIEFPDFAFDFAFTGYGPEECSVIYLVPSSDDDARKIQESEIIAHLLGRYKGGTTI